MNASYQSEILPTGGGPATKCLHAEARKLAYTACVYGLMQPRNIVSFRVSAARLDTAKRFIGFGSKFIDGMFRHQLISVGWHTVLHGLKLETMTRSRTIAPTFTVQRLQIRLVGVVTLEQRLGARHSIYLDGLQTAQ